jgi:hypothetical protein
MSRVFWTQRQDVGPSARGGHAISYNSDDKRVMLFGGRAGGGDLQDDSWEWDGTYWTQVADTGPDARSGHALAYDSNRQRLVLFGGEAAGPALRADTWEWDGTDWTQVADTGPGPSLGLAMTFGGGSTLLFGGLTSSPAAVAADELSGLSWEWNGAHWTLRQNMGPAPRWGHALAFDLERGRAILFGGFSAMPGDPNVADSVLGDTWEASLQPTPPQPPGTAVALVSFELNPDTILETTGGQISFVVGIDGPAPAGGIQVDIFHAESVMLSVLVTEGEAMGSSEISVPAGTPLGDYEFVARLGEVDMTAILHVVPA